MAKRIIKFILLCCFLYPTFGLEAQFRTLHLNIGGIEYDSVRLSLTTPNYRHRVQGVSADRHLWQFQIPDSIFDAFFLTGFWATKAGAKEEIIFDTKYGETNFVDFSNVKDIYLNTRYKERAKRVGNFVYLLTLLEKGTDKDAFLTRLFTKKYFEWGDGSLPSDQLVANYVNLITQHPDSYVLMKLVYMCIDVFQANEAQQMYDAFSESARQTRPGNSVREYIERKKKFLHFDNIALPDWKSGNLEPIMRDTTKYNLVVFSASWCGPCHKQIPLLKQIHKDLGLGLDIVYVSTDKPESVDRWKQLMVDEQIPWRSVLAAERKKEINEKYFVSVIPFSYLVYPDGRFEKIDIRLDKDRQKLYELIKKAVTKL